MYQEVDSQGGIYTQHSIPVHILSYKSEIATQVQVGSEIWGCELRTRVFKVNSSCCSTNIEQEEGGD
ncbi:unnamed protein product [Phytophthora lilii]|uniref:Unnamed protein product n=1 Tax=Phytophthora lilii TaxID=2077276 RepID=A0A9W6U0U9_9STRA|nr:unnamed protein product [Phytophthora lilii]